MNIYVRFLQVFLHIFYTLVYKKFYGVNRRSIPFLYGFKCLLYRVNTDCRVLSLHDLSTLLWTLPFVFLWNNCKRSTCVLCFHILRSFKNEALVYCFIIHLSNFKQNYLCTRDCSKKNKRSVNVENLFILQNFFLLHRRMYVLYRGNKLNRLYCWTRRLVRIIRKSHWLLYNIFLFLVVCAGKRRRQRNRTQSALDQEPARKKADSRKRFAENDTWA